MLLVGALIIIGALYALYRVVTYRPMMEVNSWGDPDPGEACGWACIMLMATLAAIAMVVLVWSCSWDRLALNT